MEMGESSGIPQVSPDVPQREAETPVAPPEAPQGEEGGPLVASPEGVSDSNGFHALGDLIDLGIPDVNPDFFSLLYQEVCEQIYLEIGNLIDRLPLILPDPHRVTLFEIIRFSLFDEEEANLVFLQDVLQDLLTFGPYSDFFQWFRQGLHNVIILW